MGLVGTYDGLVKTIDGLVQAGCCCDPCDCEIDGPTAAFDYDQVNNSPCTINLFDQSVAGACGAIVSWRWLKNGVQFSTSQNPSSVTVTTGDDITLEITDASGCPASVVMEITCVAICQACCFAAIETVTVIASGFTNGTCPGPGNCTVLNGTHVLTQVNPLNACLYEKNFATNSGCAAGEAPFIQFEMCTGSPKAIQVFFGPTGSAAVGLIVAYQMVWPSTPTDCRGTHTLNRVGTTALCGSPLTITVIIT
jgi:hypothetical protein